MNNEAMGGCGRFDGAVCNTTAIQDPAEGGEARVPLPHAWAETWRSPGIDRLVPVVDAWTPDDCFKTHSQL